MWYTLIAIILLIFLATFFVSFKVNFGKKVELKSTEDRVNDILEEEIPGSSIQARYREMRWEFLRFADFFLLVNRPFSLKLEDDSTEFGSITVGADQGYVETSSANQCQINCRDSMNCNAWSFDGSTCNKYSITSTNDYSSDTNTTNQIGYIFRPDDSWAVEDLSELPAQRDVFEGVADMVLKLNCKITALRNRASSIVASSNVKYCYETDPVLNGSPSQKYIDERDDAIASLERASMFFIFPGSSADYDNKAIYAMTCARLLNAMIGGLPADSEYWPIFADEDESVKLAIREAVGVLMGADSFYQTVENWLIFHDRDYSGSITRSELRELINDAADGKFYLDITDIASDKIKNPSSLISIDDTLWGDVVKRNDETCVTGSQVDAMIDNFFEVFDLNRNGEVTLEEMAECIESTVEDLERPKCTFE